MEKEKGAITIKKENLWLGLAILFAVLFVITLLWSPFGGNNTPPTDNGNPPAALEGSTFLPTGDSICTDSSGKPYVILFSTTWCPHCTWIADTFDGLSNEDFADKINLQHWEIDTGDNTLTTGIEAEVPADIKALYEKYNPRGSIPTFVFGCSYARVGNGYESQDDLAAELDDFKLVINKLL